MRDLVVRRVAANPVLGARADSTFNCPACNCTTHWESRFVYNPAAVLYRGAVHLLYRAQDARLTSRIGLAVAADGVHFERRAPAEPVFYPDASASSRLANPSPSTSPNPNPNPGPNSSPSPSPNPSPSSSPNPGPNPSPNANLPQAT